jgi:hypothetical protein
MTRNAKLILLIPALWASLFDVVLTIVHQSKAYWSGDLTAGEEGNPIGAFFMRSHVSGLFVISIAWLMIVAALGYFLPRKISSVFLLFVVMVHSYGASTWLLNRYGFWYVMVLALFNAILFYWAKDLADKDIKLVTVTPEIDEQQPK